MAEINVNVTTTPPAVIQTNVTVQPPTQPVVNVVSSQGAGVFAVNGKQGYVSLNSSDVGLGNVDNVSQIGISGVLQSGINSANISISSLSGTLTGYYETVAAFVASGSGIQLQISGLTTNLATTGSTLATNLATTGSVLSSRIFSLSGTLTTNESTISTNLATTGSNLQGQINSLSGNLVTSGSNLYSSINSLSGYSNNTFATITNVYTTGQTLSTNIATVATNLATTGSTLSSSISTLTSNLSTTGSTLASSINSLSGTLTNNYATYAQLTGVSGYDALTYVPKSQTGSFISTSQTGLFYPASNPSAFITGVDLSAYYPRNNPSGFITGINTGNFVTTSSAAFTVRPTVNGTGVLLSGEASAVTLPSGIVYTTGTQVLGGSYNFTGTLQYNGVTVSTGAASTGNYYPLNSNPSGYITTGQTGAFYPASNPSGFITGVNLSSYATYAQLTGLSGYDASTYLPNSQTGSFYPNSNPSGFISVNKANLNAIAYAIALG